jgi:hypothetical protein
LAQETTTIQTRKTDPVKSLSTFETASPYLLSLPKERANATHPQCPTAYLRKQKKNSRLRVCLDEPTPNGNVSKWRKMPQITNQEVCSTAVDSSMGAWDVHRP